ncbi:MAG: hypothetical protein H7259_04285 [Cytophagales bacterium]|nr:hypothetical protein [Cytophaga sp.]
MWHIVVFTTLFIFCLAGCNKEPEAVGTAVHARDTAAIVQTMMALKNKDDQRIFSDTTEPEDDDADGYNELAHESNRILTRSEYNEDLEDIFNIKRPGKSSIKQYPYSKEQLFGIWVIDPGPDEPHATFELTAQSFYVVDYDGDGSMPYEIVKDSITIYYNDFIQKGKIIDSKNPERLIIHWEEADQPTTYYTWKF